MVVFCEWVGGVLFVDGFLCSRCLVLLLLVSGCGNVASPVEYVLSLFCLCAFKMNPMCVVTFD